jgi:uncharacterized protein YqgC (DUF456 family)
MDPHILLYVIAAVLIVLGIAGTVVLLPGVPIVFAGMLLAAWADDFRVIPVWVIVLLATMTLFALAIDIAASLLGAKRVGASRMAIVGAALGTLVGLFFSIPGLLLGPFLGALAGEWIHSRDLEHASRVGIGTWTGMIVGMLFKLILMFAMVGVFLFAIVFR